MNVTTGKNEVDVVYQEVRVFVVNEQPKTYPYGKSAI